MGGCGVGDVSGRVELETREGRVCGGTGCGSDVVMGVGNENEEGTRVGPGGTCKYTVGGMGV